jgi:hypothetical protein
VAKGLIANTRPIPKNTVDMLCECMTDELVWDTRVFGEAGAGLSTTASMNMLPSSLPVCRPVKGKVHEAIAVTALGALISLSPVLPASPAAGDFLVATVDNGVSRPMFDMDEFADVSLTRAAESMRTWHLSEEDARVISEALSDGSARPGFGPLELPQYEG